MTALGPEKSLSRRRVLSSEEKSIEMAKQFQCIDILQYNRRASANRLADSATDGGEQKLAKDTVAAAALQRLLKYLCDIRSFILFLLL